MDFIIGKWVVTQACQIIFECSFILRGEKVDLKGQSDTAVGMSLFRTDSVCG